MISSAEKDLFFGEEAEAIKALGPWFHNIHLPSGRQTRPDHELGDFPSYKWRQIEVYLPRDLSGWRCLDLGCNAGFYSIELAKRGAEVVGVDVDDRFLKQALWASAKFDYPGKSPVFRRMQVYDVARAYESFDLILFMGLFYHLRYPLLALDSLSPLCRRLMIFQSLSFEHEGEELEEKESPSDFPLEQRQMLAEAAWPKMAFVEKKMAKDPTNWWVLNQSGALALLRSTGFEKIQKIGHEMFLCIPPKDGVESRRAWDAREFQSAFGIDQRKKGV